MMKKSSLFLSRAGACGALALLLALFSCNKFSDLSDPDGDGLLRPGQSTEPKVIRYERVGVGVEGQSQSSAPSLSSEGTRATFDETSGAFSWQSGDVIRIQRSESAAVDVTITTSGSAASVEVPLVGSETRAGFAYYPASIQPDTSVEAVRSTTVTLPDTYDNYTFPYAPTPMIAVQADADGVITGSNLNFQHLGGIALLELKVASDVTANVTSIKVTADKRITGTFTASVSSGHYQIATDGASSNTSLTYNLASPVAPGGTQKLFLPLPVGTYTISRLQAFSSDGNRVALSSASTSSFNITRKGGKRFIDSNAIALASAPAQDYSVYQLVYGTGNCIVDSLKVDNRSVNFSAQPYEAGENYLYTSQEALPKKKKLPVDAKVLWYEGLSKAPSASLNTGTYQVTVSGISGTGNCVVGLYNSSNEIIWSFHVWSPGYDPTASANVRTYTGTDSKSYTVMGTALGATACSTAKETTWSYTHCGMYYQWGRKDPLGRVNSSKALSGTAVQSDIVPSTSNVIAVDASSFSNSQSASEHIAYTIKNPHMFITSSVDDSYNWLTSVTYTSTASDTWDNKLWGTTYDDETTTYTEIGKTIFDPCPAGWKVPTTGIVFGKTSGSSAGSGTNKVGFQHTSPNDYFVYLESRDSSSGVVGTVTNNGYYWSSCQYSSFRCDGQYLLTYGTSNFAPTHHLDRAYGFTVRCVRLQN